MTRTAAPEQIVYVVDDDEAMRDSAAWLLESRGFRVRTFESAEAFLEIYGPALSGCLVLDVRMPGMSGLELFDKLRQTAGRTPLIPVIFVTGHGDVPMAVGALKQGAADFIEKPFNDNELVRLVEQCLARECEQRARHHIVLDDMRRLESLTEREKEVMRLIVAGRLNKQIADDLGISIKTVEVHRARVMEKMDVRAVAELVQAVMRGGFR
ncbi:MAG: response regulator transcription factor [Rhodocyclaceae bacterium]|nr:response regulator transcription factor [Rhodocyclaceae bacterium]MBX3667099.1 response regulator transcription factor [Rhodocyclaceae bacterium]